MKPTIGTSSTQSHTENKILSYYKNISFFSSITDGKDLFISQILHKAFIDVDEEGAEAAAATAVIMELTNGGGSSRIVFDYNHPFMYLIQHKQIGTILFMGSINNLSS